MRSARAIAFVGLSMFLAVASARADVESGPSAKAKVPKLEVTGVAGDNAGKSFDVAAARGEQPTVYVIVPKEKFGRPTARFLKALDTAIAKQADKERVVAVWLSDEPKETQEYLPRVQQSLKLEATEWTVFPSTTQLPDGWSLNTDAHVTAVVTSGGKVVKSFAYGSVNETQAEEVLKAREASK